MLENVCPQINLQYNNALIVILSPLGECVEGSGVTIIISKLDETLCCI